MPERVGPASMGGPHPTTVSGQASAPAAGKSHRGLWAALALLVVGGGVTAAVVAGSGSGTTGPTSSPPPQSPTTPTMPMTIPNASNWRQVVAAQQAPLGAVGPGQWFAFHLLNQPGWDPKNVDVDGFIKWATSTAKSVISDAQLSRIDVSNVFPDGHADLTLSSSGFISVRFASPSRSKPDPSVPLGAQPNWHCMFQVMATVQTGPFITPMDGTSCEDERPLTPRCNTRGVWQQMIARKAPSGNVVAQIGFWADKGQAPEWYGSVDRAFSQRFPDACP